MGTLFVVSTPIGNLEDITIRAQKTLASVDLVLCEDTRRTAKLTNQPLLRFDDYTERQRTPEVIEMLKDEKNIALVSDAGTPLVSDPGFTLVREAINRGIKVVSIPGPSAVLAALTTSGLPSDKFLFLGYPPEKQSHRLKLFQSLPKNTTIIFYCAPHKLKQTLEDMQSVFGDIDIVLCRELTKIHEEVWRGSVALAKKESLDKKGEFVLLFRLSVGL